MAIIATALDMADWEGPTAGRSSADIPKMSY